MERLNLALENARLIILNRFAFLNTIDSSQLVEMFQVALLAMMFALAGISVYYVSVDVSQEKKLYGKKRKTQSVFVKLVSSVFSGLNRNVTLYFKERGGNQDRANQITTVIIVGVFSFSAFLIAVGQIFFAFSLPLTLLMAINHVIVELRTSFSESVKRAMPQAVNGILRTMTKYSDLQTVLYETSKISTQPLKGILEEMARMIVSSSSDIVINKTMSKYNNTWLYSLLFILLSYVEGSPKEEVVNNLRALRDIVDRENKTKNTEKLERKMTVAINYALVALAIGGGVLNILFNDNAISFFFSTPVGLLAFFGSFLLISVTIFSNIFISKGGGE